MNKGTYTQQIHEGDEGNEITWGTHLGQIKPDETGESKAKHAEHGAQDYHNKTGNSET